MVNVLCWHRFNLWKKYLWSISWLKLKFKGKKKIAFSNTEAWTSRHRRAVFAHRFSDQSQCNLFVSRKLPTRTIWFDFFLKSKWRWSHLCQRRWITMLGFFLFVCGGEKILAKICAALQAQSINMHVEPYSAASKHILLLSVDQFPPACNEAAPSQKKPPLSSWQFGSRRYNLMKNFQFFYFFIFFSGGGRGREVPVQEQ